MNYKDQIFKPCLPYNPDRVSRLCHSDKVKSITKLIDSLQKNKTEIKILDFGCGRGELLKILKEKGYKNIFGIDIDDYCIKLSSRFAKIFSSMEELKDSIGLESVDIIVLSHVLEHLNNPLSTLQEMKKVTKKFIIVAVPNPLATFALFKAIIRRPESTHCTHFWGWDAGELRNFLEAHNGFRIIRWRGDYVAIFPYIYMLDILPEAILVFIKKLLYLVEVIVLPYLFPFFTSTLICLCEKQDKRTQS